jgi:triphosphoribosyl-dephospho-CoA synthase
MGRSDRISPEMGWPGAGAAPSSLFAAACRAEILALKPGNVHVHADGHGMTAAQFIESAEVAAPALARRGCDVGTRILDAVAATRAAVGCNTNLGILLLSAPLLQAADDARPSERLEPALARVLDALDLAAAERAYEAIRIAAPGGLGRAERHDVAARPEVGLREAMAAAAERDRIAAQYATGFADVFGIGARSVKAARRAGADPVGAVEAAYWDFLTAFEDSHVARKHGADTAAWLLACAREIRGRVHETPSSPEGRKIALEFDRDLKLRGINPGTSADLSVASLLAVLLEDRLSSATPPQPHGRNTWQRSTECS